MHSASNGYRHVHVRLARLRPRALGHGRTSGGGATTLMHVVGRLRLRQLTIDHEHRAAFRDPWRAGSEACSGSVRTPARNSDEKYWSPERPGGTRYEGSQSILRAAICQCVWGFTGLLPAQYFCSPSSAAPSLANSSHAASATTSSTRAVISSCAVVGTRQRERLAVDETAFCCTQLYL